MCPANLLFSACYVSNGSCHSLHTKCHDIWYNGTMGPYSMNYLAMGVVYVHVCMSLNSAWVVAYTYICIHTGRTRIAVLFGRLTSLSSGEDKFWFKRDEIADVASGDSHAAVLTVSGQLFMLGANEWGQLGVGHTRSLTKPVHVKGEPVQKTH